MSWMAGFGKAFSNIGEDLGEFVTRRDRLHQQALENALRDRQIGTQEEQTRLAFEREQRLDNAQQRDDDRQRWFGMADRFGGQELDPEAYAEIPTEYRSLLTERTAPTIAGDSKIAGAIDPITAQPIETQVQAGPDTTRFRVPETDATRRAREANASRQQIAHLRSRQFYDKLSQDRELAEMGNKLGYDRLKQMYDLTMDRIGLGYAGVDRAYDQMEFDRGVEILKANVRMYLGNQSDPADMMMWSLMNPGVPMPQQGQPGPQGPRPDPNTLPAAPTRRGGARPQGGTRGGGGGATTPDPANPLGLIRPRS